MSEVILNEMLIEKQGLKECEVEHIHELHDIKDSLFENVASLNPKNPDELEMLRYAAVELRDIEFAMQRAWRFPESVAHHTHWMWMPHCSCPKMDNMDMLGVEDMLWSNGCCPIHDPSPYGEEGVGDQVRRIEKEALDQVDDQVSKLEQDWDGQ